MIAAGPTPVLPPALLADQRYESHGAEAFFLEMGRRLPRDFAKLLAIPIAYRNYQASPDLELLLERLGRFRAAGGYQNCIKRRFFGQALCAIADPNVDIAVAERVHACRRLPAQRLMALYRKHLVGDLAHDGGGIARAGANLERPVSRTQLRSLDHGRDDIGLGYCLAFADRQRGIFIGEFGHGIVGEAFARHSAHGGNHKFIAHASSRDLHIHHPIAQSGKVRHGSKPFLDCVFAANGNRTAATER